jgi:hypothetical protein
MSKGWHYQSARHALAARGIKIRSAEDHEGYRSLKDILDASRSLSDVTHDELLQIQDDPYLMMEFIGWLKKHGFFDKMICDGHPHLMRGIGRHGIAYMVDLDREEVCFMEITEIAGSTDDDYWTREQVSYDLWGTEHNRSYVVTQYVRMDLKDVIEGVVNGARWVGYYGTTDKLIDNMISKVAYGDEGEEMVYYSRQEAFDTFKEMC